MVLGERGALGYFRLRVLRTTLDVGAQFGRLTEGESSALPCCPAPNMSHAALHVRVLVTRQEECSGPWGAASRAGTRSYREPRNDENP